jgi:hypothetical protein
MEVKKHRKRIIDIQKTLQNYLKIEVGKPFELLFFEFLTEDERMPNPLFLISPVLKILNYDYSEKMSAEDLVVETIFGGTSQMNLFTDSEIENIELKRLDLTKEKFYTIAEKIIRGQPYWLSREVKLLKVLCTVTDEVEETVIINDMFEYANIQERWDRTHKNN